MRIIEILIQSKPGNSGEVIGKSTYRELYKEIQPFVDKLAEPGLSIKGREFLKSVIKDKCQNAIGIDLTVGSEEPTNSPKQPIKPSTKTNVDWKSLMNRSSQIGMKVTEAVRKIPLISEDFDRLKSLMENPIPAVVAHIFIGDLIDDDELSDSIKSIEEVHPGRDVRPLIAEWVKRVMPDQLYRFRDDKFDTSGNMSPINKQL